MSPLENSDHLRVLTPQTKDGVTLIYDEDRQVIMKTTFMPLTAKKYLDRKNKNLPEHLRHTIEVVKVKKDDKKVTPADDFANKKK